MHLLPYDSLTLQTSAPLPLVLERLDAHIEPPKLGRWFFSRDHKPYEGTLSESGFEIQRIIHYRNSFLPLIRGRFEASPTGTIVRITMRLHAVVIGFLAFWYLTWYSFFLPIWLTGAMPTAIALQFVGLPVVILIVFWVAFWVEVQRSRDDLAQIILGRSLTHAQLGIPNVLLWGFCLLGFAVVFLQVKGNLWSPVSEPPASLAAVSCSQQPVPSPYCKFANVYTLAGHPSASTLALSTNSQILVSGGNDKAIKVWDLATGQLRKTLQSDSGQIRSLAIAPDGKTVVSGSADHMVRIWSLTSNQSPRMLAGHPNEVTLVKITLDGKRLISGSYGAIKVWDLKTGQLQTTFPSEAKSETKLGPITVINDAAQQFNPLDINTASNTVLIGDRRVVDLATHQVRAVPQARGDNFFADYFLTGALSLDGKLGILQYGNTFKKFETRLKVRDLTTGMITGETSATFSRGTFVRVPIVVSRDRIFGSSGQQLQVWNLQTAQLEAVMDTGRLDPLVVNADGSILAGLTHDAAPNTRQIKVWRR